MTTTIVSIFSGIAGMFGWGIYDFLGGVFTRQIGSLKSFFWSQLAGCLSLLALALVMARHFGAGGLMIALSLLAAAVYSAGYLFFFKGFEVGNMSIVAASMNLWAVFTMLFAFIFLGQRLSGVQSVGVLLILCGITLASVNWRDLQRQGFQLSAGVREAVLGAFFFGIFWNISEVISEEIGWLLTTLLVKSGIVVCMLIYSRMAKRPLGLAHTSGKVMLTVGVMGVLEAAAVAAVNFGLTIGDAILITPIASALSIVTISLAVIFLKERITRLQGAGIAAAILGIVVTAF